MDPITGLALGRIGIGALSLIAPRLTAKLFLLDAKANPQLPYLARLFGSRELALGALTLASTGAARQRFVTAGIAVDGADVLTGLASTASGAVPKRTGLLLAVAAAGAVAAGVIGLKDS